MRRLLLAVLVLILLTALAAGGGWLWFSTEITHDGPHAADRVVLIPPGSSVRAIAGKLTDAGIVRSDLLFRLAARTEGAERALKSGEFLFPARASITGVLGILAKGDTVDRNLTIPEGLTVAEALDIVAKAEGLTGRCPTRRTRGACCPRPIDMPITTPRPRPCAAWSRPWIRRCGKPGTGGRTGCRWSARRRP